MDNDHLGLQIWECILCDLPEQFYDAETFQSHLCIQHKGAVKDFKSFSAACMANAPPIVSSCPLCTWAGEQSEIVDPSFLLDHIAEHVHSFSLRSLPWSSASAIVREETSEHKSDTYIDSWLSGIDKVSDIQPDEVLSVSHPVEHLPGDLTAHIGQVLDFKSRNFENQQQEESAYAPSNYFDSHDYFGEDADDSFKASVQPGGGSQDDFSDSSTRHIDEGNRILAPQLKIMLTLISPC